MSFWHIVQTGVLTIILGFISVIVAGLITLEIRDILDERKLERRLKHYNCPMCEDMFSKDRKDLS